MSIARRRILQVQSRPSQKSSPSLQFLTITEVLDMKWYTGFLPEPLYLEAADAGIHNPQEIVETHWDGVVRLIGADGSGYIAARELLRRLEGLVQLSRDEGSRSVFGHGRQPARANRFDILRASALRLEDVILREGYGQGNIRLPASGEIQLGYHNRKEHRDGYGETATLRSSLGWPELKDRANERDDRWIWRVQAGDPNTPDHYVLLYDGRELPHELRRLPADLTWAQALEATRSVLAQAEAFAQYCEEEILEFRRQVVADVLLLYEVTGTVVPFAAIEQRYDAPPIEKDDIVGRTTYEVINGDEVFTSRNKVLEAVRDRLEQEGHQIGKGGVREALKRLGAYREAGKQGEAGDHITTIELSYLRWAIRSRYGRRSVK